MHDLVSRTLIACAVLTLTAGPATPAQTQNAGTPDSSAQRASLLQTIQQTDSLATFLSTLRVSGLTELMKRDGPFTVFAPTEAAFAALPKSTFAPLLRPENRAQLRALLRYHVVEGRFTAEALQDRPALETLQGATVGVDTSQAALILRDGRSATITTHDLPASNGILHVIDTVLTPPKTTADHDQ
jgi:Secreted and surface protein containing fasciclin-like repeats